MSVTVIGFDENSPTTNVTVTPLTVPVGVQEGDMIHVFSTRPGSAASLTLSGVSGFSAATEVSASGFRGHYWWKISDGTEGGDTLNVNNATSMRNSSAVVVTRGQALSAPIATGDALATTATVTASKTASSGTADEPVVVLQAMLAAGSHAAVTGYTGASVTEVLESFNNASSNDVTGLAVYFRSSEAEAYGGNVFAQQFTATTGNVTMVFTIPLLIAPETVVTTYNPTSTTDAGSWTNEGGAASIHAALSDVSDATYAESPDDPSAEDFTVAFGTVADEGPITVFVRGYKADAGTDIDLTVELLETSTVRATRTMSLTTSAEDFSFTTTSGETASITARTNLRVRITATEV